MASIQGRRWFSEMVGSARRKAGLDSGLRVRFEIDKKTFQMADKLLAELPEKMRRKALTKGIRSAAKLVGTATRGNITQPGYFGDKDQGKYPPLSKNIKWVVRGGAKKPYVAAHVGADYKKAPHFHLYERGHKMVTHRPNKRTVGYVVGEQDFKRAIDETKTMQQGLLLKEIRDFIKLGQFK